MPLIDECLRTVVYLRLSVVFISAAEEEECDENF